MTDKMLTFQERIDLQRRVQEAWSKLTPAERQARISGELIDRITKMAKAVKGRALWPAWSTGETLMVAIVLDQPERLKDEGYSMAEAFNRVDLSLSELLAIQRELS